MPFCGQDECRNPSLAVVTRASRVGTEKALYEFWTWTDLMQSITKVLCNATRMNGSGKDAVASAVSHGAHLELSICILLAIHSAAVSESLRSFPSSQIIFVETCFWRRFLVCETTVVWNRAKNFD